jgi:hypothetical protein
MLSGLEVKGTKRNCAIALSSADVNNGIERDKRYGEIRRMGRDTAITRSKNCVRSTNAREGGATRAWLAFVTRSSDVPKIWAPCALEDVSAYRGHVAYLTRRSEKQRLTDDRIAFPESRIPCDVAHATECSEAQTSAWQFGHARESGIICAEHVDVDQQGRALDVEFHQVDECRSTGNEASGPTRAGLGSHGIVHRCRAPVFEVDQ